jgi:hypothetical protein
MTRRAARPIKRSRSAEGWRGTGWSRFVNRARLTGLALALGGAGSIGWLVTNPAFALDADALEISGMQYTDATAVRDALALPAGAPNVFLLNTDAMRRAVAKLPSVAAAEVHIVLPDRLMVSVTERTSVLQVARAGVTYLLDAAGVVLQARANNAPLITDLPRIDDQRVELGIPFEVGREIDPTESAAMMQIGALTPALVGSTVETLVFAATDTDGFVVSAAPGGWRAVFGFYTPTLRPPTLIAQQVACLRNLLANGEGQIATIYLAPQGDRCGTYLPRPT